MGADNFQPLVRKKYNLSRIQISSSEKRWGGKWTLKFVLSLKKPVPKPDPQPTFRRENEKQVFDFSKPSKQQRGFFKCKVEQKSSWGTLELGGE